MGSIPRYTRSYGPRMRWGRMLTPAIRNIIIACTGVFLVQTLLNLFVPTAQRFYLTEFGLVPLAVVHGLRIWQPFTYLFLHDGILHLLFNMLFLWMFGVDLGRTWGTHSFYVYFFLTGGGSGRWESKSHPKLGKLLQTCFGCATCLASLAWRAALMSLGN